MLLDDAPRFYYHKKIAEIKQDLKDNESQIVKYYNYKGEYITEWAQCLEKLHPDDYKQPINTICSTIVNELTDMDLTKGIGYVYKLLDKKYKNPTFSELGERSQSGNTTALENSSGQGDDQQLPYDISSLDVAPPSQLQENESYIRDKMDEWKRRHTEYVKKMHDRHIAVINQKESEVESTARPYNPREGHFYKEALNVSSILEKFADTHKQMADNIKDYPPRAVGHERLPDCACSECEAVDLELAKGLQYWAMYYSALYEYHRPFADKKFSSSYVKWFRTEILNNVHGKHAAAVMSKVLTYLDEERELTREQVGDKLTDLYKKLVKFCGAMEMQRYMIEDVPEIWHEKMLVPCVADRKVRVGPILSESSFGSDKH